MRPERNYDFSWTIQHIEGEYWWFNDMGEPNGPYLNYDEAMDGLDWYSYNWDIREMIENGDNFDK